MKYIHLAVSLLFFLFGVVQYNDPDFFIWIPIYLFVSFVSFASFKGLRFPFITLVVLIMLGIWLATYFPAFITWVKDGMPSVTGAMKAESPYIEHVREFGGLLISFITALIYYFIHKKTQDVNPE